MFRKLSLVILSSISLLTSVFAMQDSEEKRQDWLKIIRADANFCHESMTSNPSQMPSFLGSVAAGISNAAEYARVQFRDEHINPVELDKEKRFFGLHEAARYGHVDLVRAYLRHRIDPHKKGPDSKTPKELAEHFAKQAPNDDRQNYVDIISLLKNAGQKVTD